ncbi:MAG: phosphate signaling complex protein PhoU [Candidatus Aminicenantes bacterium]|nr:phosphate signaling complex protein PhoU [Candidatus Aminicenantes bacterium]
MSAHLEKAINNLLKQLTALSARVEESVKRSFQALDENNADLARKVIMEDEIIDKQEIDIEEECLKILALHQPVAIDLRYLVAVMKINNDLERIGDLAVNISWHTLDILSEPLLKKPVDFQEMCRLSQSMLKRSLDSLVNLDANTAYAVLKEDDEVDRMNAELSAEIVEAIKNNPAKADVLVLYIHIARHLERIADHATNIAEDIIYLIAGEIIRHGKSI